MAIQIKTKKTYLIFDSPTVQDYIEGEGKRGLDRWDFGYLLLNDPPNNRRRIEIWRQYMDGCSLEDIRKEAGIDTPINSRATLHYELKRLIDHQYLFMFPDTGEIDQISGKNLPVDIPKAAIKRLYALRYDLACSNGLVSFIGLDKYLLSNKKDTKLLNDLLDEFATELQFKYRTLVDMWIIIKLEEISTSLHHYLHSSSFTMKWKAAMLLRTAEKTKERVNSLTGGLLTVKNPDRYQSKERKIIKKYLRQLEKPQLYEPVITLETIRKEIPNSKKVLKSKKFNEWFEKESGLLMPLDKPIVVLGSIFEHGLDKIPKEDWKEQSQEEILSDIKEIEKAVLGRGKR